MLVVGQIRPGSVHLKDRQGRRQPQCLWGRKLNTPQLPTRDLGIAPLSF